MKARPRLKIRRPTPEQERLRGMVALTQIWVTGHPRHLASGKFTWVDGYWRNQRPGESLLGKVTKPGTAFTGPERAKRGIAFEPPPGLVQVPAPMGTKIDLLPGEFALRVKSNSPNAVVYVRHRDGTWDAHYADVTGPDATGQRMIMEKDNSEELERIYRGESSRSGRYDRYVGQPLQSEPETPERYSAKPQTGRSFGKPLWGVWDQETQTWFRASTTTNPEFAAKQAANLNAGLAYKASKAKPPEPKKAERDVKMIPGPAGVDIPLYPGEVAVWDRGREYDPSTGESRPRTDDEILAVYVQHADGSWTAFLNSPTKGKPSQVRMRLGPDQPSYEKFLRYAREKDPQYEFIEGPKPKSQRKFAPGARVYLPGSGMAATVIRLQEDREDSTFRDGKPVPGSGRVYLLRYDDGKTDRKVEYILEPAATPTFSVGQWVKGPDGRSMLVTEIRQPSPNEIHYVVTRGIEQGDLLEGQVSPGEVPTDLPDPGDWAPVVPSSDMPSEQAAKHWTAIAALRKEGVVVGEGVAPASGEEGEDVERLLILDSYDRRWEKEGTNLDNPSEIARRIGRDTGPRGYYAQPDPEPRGAGRKTRHQAQTYEDSARLAHPAEGLLGRKSRWTGRVGTDRAGGFACASMSFGGKLEVELRWQARKEVPTEEMPPGLREQLVEQGGLEESWAAQNAREYNRRRLRILLHEQVHALSTHPVPRAEPIYYEKAPAYEEGVVEGWTQTHFADVVNSDPDLLAQVMPEGQKVDRALAADHLESGMTSYAEYVQWLVEIARILGFLDPSQGFEEMPEGLDVFQRQEWRKARRADGYRKFFDILLRIPLQFRRDALLSMASSRNLSPEDARLFDKAIRELDKGKPM